MSITEAVLVTRVKARSIFASEFVEIDASAATVTAIDASADFKALDITFLIDFLTSAEFVDHFVNTKSAAVVNSGATLRLSFQEATLFAAN